MAKEFATVCGTSIAHSAATVHELTFYRILIGAAGGVFVCALLAVGCVQGRPASDTSDPGFPFGPSAVGSQTISYNQDIKPIFDRDCLECHSSRNARGNYSVATYSAAVAGQRPGDASSSVVVDCSPGGSMYRYFTGDAVTEATMVFRWMVVYNAAETR
jgi:hypothetical protein